MAIDAGQFFVGTACISWSQ